MKKIIITILLASCVIGCDARPVNQANDISQESQAAPASGGGGIQNVSRAANDQTAQTGPKTIRDFFMLLPEKYFTLESCDRETDKECKKAREEYLKNFGDVVDIKNGYLKGGCDGGQACIEMAIFKRPDGTYLVAVATSSEMMNDNFFLDHDNNGAWTDISASVVPEFSRKNIYELPRVGTTVKVFEKKIVESGDDFEASEKGKKLYDLKWQDGKFSVVR